MKMTTKKICRAGIIAGLYVLLSLCFQPLSFGAVQFRLSEALTVLPLFYFESVPALFVGCLISNFFGCGVYDVIIGSTATLIAGIITFFVGETVKNKHLKFWLGITFTVVINAFAVPLVLLLSGMAENGYFIEVLTVGGGEFAVLLTLGQAFYYAFFSLGTKQ